MLTKADIDWLTSELVPALADAVQKKLERKLDDISTKLDKFVGDIQAKREERVATIEKHLHIPTAP